MTELVYKGRRLTEEERRKKNQEHSKFQGERMKRELAEAKALKKKKEPYTKEEKKERELIAQEENRRKILAKLQKDNRPAMPLNEILIRINEVGKDRVANDLGFPVHFIGSWKLFSKGDIQNGWTPLGTKLGNQLQDYLYNARLNTKT